MKNPDGKECAFYYEDFNRGRNRQECRLVWGDWQISDCKGCPVPPILSANGDPNLKLEGEIKKGFLGIGRKVIVSATCAKHIIDVENPITGCPKCAAERPGLADLFKDL